MRSRTTSSPTTRALRIAVAVAAPLALISCGDDDDDTSDSAAANTTGVAETSSSGSTTVATSAAVQTSAPGRTTAPDTSVATSVATTGEGAGAGVTYASPQGDYSAVFPSEPTEQTRPTPLPDGSQMDLEIAGVETDDRFYGTVRGEYPKGTTLDVPGALQGAQEQAIANVKGTLIDSRDIELQGRPGREFSASFTSNGEAGTLLQRIYLDGTVMYQNIVTGAGELTFEDPAIAAFFESFRLARN
jgi:hypothetical protein